jgi:uncharacterized phage-associated protein
MVYKALDVARYIINYSNRMGYGISNMKLQKLLYFIQAKFVAFTEKKKPCFIEEIEAWEFGPVVPEVYQAFKQYGSSSIPAVKKYYEVNDDWKMIEKNYDEECIEPQDREIINQTVDDFADYSAAALVNITHDQDPWNDAYVEGMNRVISKTSVKEYFECDDI